MFRFMGHRPLTTEIVTVIKHLYSAIIDSESPDLSRGYIRSSTNNIDFRHFQNIGKERP